MAWAHFSIDAICDVAVLTNGMAIGSYLNAVLPWRGGMCMLSPCRAGHARPDNQETVT